MAPASGATITIAGSIDDEHGSGLGNSADKAGLVINGPGTVDLTGTESDFTGGTTLEAGTLILGAAGAAGTGGVTFAAVPVTLVIAPADTATGTISGFTLSDAIVLTSFTETSLAISGNVLTLSNAANTTETLTFVSAPSAPDLLITTESGNTTIQNLIGTITTRINQQVSLGNGTYAPNLSVTSTGTINGAYTGIAASAIATVTNTGSIAGTAANGIDLHAGGAVTNSGTGAVIYSEAIAIASSGPATIANTGTIDGLGVIGINLAGGGTVSNSGTGAVIFGRNCGILAYAASTVTNNSTIIASYWEGIYLRDGGAVTNSGTIQGGHDAIYSKTGAFSLTALPGAVFTGAVYDSVSTGELILAGTTTGRLSIASFTGFPNISFAHGAAWTLEGTAAQLTEGETIAGFAAGDTLVLQGVTASTGSFVPGTGLVLSDGAGDAGTLNVNSIAGANFYTSFSSGGTTIHALIGTIATTITQAVSLNNGTYAANLSVTNTGLIEHGQYGVSAKIFGTIANAGTIEGNSAGVYLQKGDVINSSTSSVIYGARGGIKTEAAASPVTVTNAGSIITDAGDNAIYLQDGGTVTNTGTAALIYGKQAAIDAHGSATVINTGTLAAAAGDISVAVLLTRGGAVSNAGTITGGRYAIENEQSNFTLTVLPGAVFDGKVNDQAKSGDLSLAGSTASFLNIDSFSGFSTLGFAPASDWTVQGTASLFSQPTINGFAGTDSLDITDLATTGTMQANSTGTLAITDTAVSGGTLDLVFSGLTSNDYFVLSSDFAGGTDISIACFCPGTRITTATGSEAVEQLQIGDLVQTQAKILRRVKWIGQRAYAAPFCNHPKVLPIKISAHAIEDNAPARDLFVSPGHAICIDGALFHASRLVNGVSITQLKQADPVRYYHIELDSHDIILAENCPAETFRGEHFRAQFANAAEFARLYPNAVEQRACLPTLTHGAKLREIQTRLAARAGITPPEGLAKLHGYIDSITAARVTGWAKTISWHEISAPLETPVVLDVFSGTTLIATVTANHFRQDLYDAGYTHGHHGFSVALPPGATNITIRRHTDGAPLPHAHPQAA